MGRHCAGVPAARGAAASAGATCGVSAPYRTEQLTLDAPATPTPDPIPAPPFHRQYLPEILRHEDWAVSWEALVKFFADHPEETLRVNYLRLRFGEVLHQYPAKDGTTLAPKRTTINSSLTSIKCSRTIIALWCQPRTEKIGRAILFDCQRIKSRTHIIFLMQGSPGVLEWHAGAFLSTENPRLCGGVP